jgi:regulator of replication initiation timing
LLTLPRWIAMNTAPGEFELSNHQESPYWYLIIPEADSRDFAQPDTDEGESVEPQVVDDTPPIARSCSRNFRLDESRIPDEIQRNAVLAHRQRTALSRLRHKRQREEVQTSIRQLDEENAILRRNIEHLNRYLESVQVRHRTQDTSDAIMAHAVHTVVRSCSVQVLRIGSGSCGKTFQNKVFIHVSVHGFPTCCQQVTSS